MVKMIELFCNIVDDQILFIPTIGVQWYPDCTVIGISWVNINLGIALRRNEG